MNQQRAITPDFLYQDQSSKVEQITIPVSRGLFHLGVLMIMRHQDI